MTTSSDQEVAQLRAQLAAQSQLIEQLQRDMQELNTKYVAEIERAADSLHQKDVIEKELEELSCHLFEQANAMVAQERREKWELEHQLLMLRDRFQPIVHDRHINAFQTFIHHQQQLPLKRLGQCEFLKTCIEQDIEPCLVGKFGTRWSKRLIEHLLWQPCYIEKATTAPPQYNQPHPMSRSSSSPGSTLWDRLLPSSSSSSSSIHNNTNNNNARCAVCGQTSDPLLYRFRLESEQGWLHIDQHCRDRLVAVSEFYSFIRKIHLGLFTRRSIHDLYHENVRLRLQMFYARMGALIDFVNMSPPSPSPSSSLTANNDADAASLDGSVSTVSSSSTAGLPPHTPTTHHPSTLLTPPSPVKEEQMDHHHHHHPMTPHHHHL